MMSLLTNESGVDLLAVEERDEYIDSETSSGIDQQLESLLHEPNRQHHHVVANRCQNAKLTAEG